MRLTEWCWVCYLVWSLIAVSSVTKSTSRCAWFGDFYHWVLTYWSHIINECHPFWAMPLFCFMLGRINLSLLCLSCVKMSNRHKSFWCQVNYTAWMNPFRCDMFIFFKIYLYLEAWKKNCGKKIKYEEEKNVSVLRNIVFGVFGFMFSSSLPVPFLTVHNLIKCQQCSIMI